ncbi:FAD-binding protein [Zhongshania borealis]|uniref:FAD-binding protein n=1 Tax=Zhongshania borealis TaxID=889488 RepID=A0ABP7X1T8_9GAMM
MSINNKNILDTLKSQVSTSYRIQHCNDINWDDTTDVAVIGYGAAGACSALEASSLGVKVTVLDRLNGGGASALSGGIIYAGGGTAYQSQAGVEDSVENMMNYLRQEAQGAVSEETLRHFCEQSIPNLAWLEKYGVNFDSTPYSEKTSYPPENYFLYYSGNELASPYRDIATPARRGHRVKGKGFTGRVLFESLNQSAQQQNNIEIKQHCEVTRLILDQQDRLVGIELLQAPDNKIIQAIIRAVNRLANKFAVLEPKAGTLIRKLVHGLRRSGKTKFLRVRKGAILSAGGYIYNRHLVQKLAPSYTPARPLGEDCIGKGISLGVSAGGQVQHMDKVSAWRFFAPPNTMLKGVIVDEKGERICNEDLYGATAADRILESGCKRAYLILDKRMMAEASAETRISKMQLFQWAPARLFLSISSTKATTLNSLARKCRINFPRLQSTIGNYNSDAIAGKDRYHKSTDFVQAIEQSPFYAIDISLQNWRVPCFAITLGGLSVNEQTGAVLDVNGNSISGLFAAGRSAVGICSNSYVSGLSLADCVYSGRRAGHSAALEKSE